MSWIGDLFTPSPRPGHSLPWFAVNALAKPVRIEAEPESPNAAFEQYSTFRLSNPSSVQRSNILGPRNQIIPVGKAEDPLSIGKG